jgi:hypothetical protein
MIIVKFCYIVVMGMIPDCVFVAVGENLQCTESLRWTKSLRCAEKPRSRSQFGCGLDLVVLLTVGLALNCGFGCGFSCGLICGFGCGIDLLT